MIISEKQIMQLFSVAIGVSTSPEYSCISEAAKKDISVLVGQINSQQSDKLIEIKDEK